MDTVVEHYLNFKRSVCLFKQLIKEYSETEDEETFQCILIVREGILDLLTKMENTETLLG
jgi:hypothetical protein